MWGFAEIIQSDDPHLSVGERIFGYFPAADYLTLRPARSLIRVSPTGVRIVVIFPPVYNNYVRLSGENNYNPVMDKVRALLFPLHMTSFACVMRLQWNLTGASQVWLLVPLVKPVWVSLKV